MPCKNNTNLAKTSVNRLFIAKNSRRKCSRREFFRLYDARLFYRKNYPPHSSPDCRADYAYNQPRNRQPGAPSTGFHLHYPDYTQRKSGGIASKRKNITVVFQKTLIEQRKINKLTQKQAANTSESRNRLYPLRKRTIRTVFDQPCKISGFIRRFGRLSARQNGFIRVL